MKNKYTLQTVGEFYEVFDETNKITVFANESKPLCEVTLLKLRQGKISVADLKQGE